MCWYYGVEMEVDIQLDHVVVYYIPCLRVKLELAHKDQLRYFKVLYNPLLSEIEMPICERCGRRTSSQVPELDDIFYHWDNHRPYNF